MSDRRVPFYLPISSSDAESFLKDGEIPSSGLECSGLFAMFFSLTQDEFSHGNFHRLIRDVHPLFVKDKSACVPQLEKYRKHFNGVSISFITQELADRFVVFSDPIDVRNWMSGNLDRGYEEEFQKLCRHGSRDYELSVRADNDEDDDFLSGYTTDSGNRAAVVLRGSRDQEVAMRVICGSPDEVICLNAYAGTGKTHLVLNIANAIKRHMTYVAPGKAHLDGLKFHKSQVSPDVMRATTLYDFAHEIAEEYARISGSKVRRCIRSPSSIDEQATYAGIPEIDGVNSAQVLARIKRGLSAWCQTEDFSISNRHFRRVLPYGSDASAYVRLAGEFWRMMFSPSKGSRVILGIGMGELAKWLSLRNASVPAKYGTVIVDESHDLSPSWRQLLSRSPAGCVLMGDPYQRLGDYLRGDMQAKSVSMSHSMRMGVVGESLVERTISLAQDRLIDDIFHGSREHITRIKNYRSKDDFPSAGLRIYGSEWEILADALRMKGGGARFGFVDATADHLRKLIRNAVSMYVSGSTYKSAFVSGNSSWHELASMLELQGKGSIVRMFERGFREENFNDLLRAQCSDVHRRVTLSLVEHAKNFELSVVAISECCFSNEINRRGFLPLHANYLAMTRARDEIWIPGDALDRLSDLQREVA